MDKLLQSVDLLFLLSIRDRATYNILKYLNPQLSKYNDQLLDRFPLEATIHLVALGIEDDLRPTMQSLEDQYPGIKAAVRRGDIINNVDDCQYRSSGSWMIDEIAGTPVIVDRSCECDDYGCPNENFMLISEFPPGYWDSEYMPTISWEPDSTNDFYWHGDNPSCAFNPTILNLAAWPIFISPNNYVYSFIEFKFAGRRYKIYTDNPVRFKEDVLVSKKMFTYACEVSE